MPLRFQGTLVLHEVLSGLSLDFVICCSALSAVVPPIGQVGYVAANSFMDAFAHYKGECWLSIGWDTWQNVGMAVAASLPTQQVDKSLAVYKDLLHQQYNSGLLSEEGANIFLSLLSCTVPHVLVSTEVLEQKIEANKQLSSIYTSEAPAKNTGISAHTIVTVNDVEQVLAELWRGFLGMEMIDIYANWFDLGASSLDVIQINSMINTALGTSISASQMFTFSTIYALAEFIYQKDFNVAVENTHKDREDKLSAGKSRLKSRMSKARQK